MRKQNASLKWIFTFIFVILIGCDRLHSMEWEKIVYHIIYNGDIRSMQAPCTYISKRISLYKTNINEWKIEWTHVPLIAHKSLFFLSWLDCNHLEIHTKTSSFLFLFNFYRKWQSDTRNLTYSTLTCNKLAQNFLTLNNFVEHLTIVIKSQFGHSHDFLIISGFVYVLKYIFDNLFILIYISIGDWLFKNLMWRLEQLKLETCINHLILSSYILWS